jgi:hypothetical protein
MREEGMKDIDIFFDFRTRAFCRFIAATQILQFDMSDYINTIN